MSADSGQPMKISSSGYAFFFDSSSCSGCKACQIACKDMHGLPLGQVWRRVYEVSGGDWEQAGSAWVSSVFAYNLSISCNHCERPACVEACPSGAMYKRPDGIVLVDSSQCIGCKYCAWACPYGAPQYDPEAGVMTKCTFCFPLLEQDKPPACVSACPLRALDYGSREELERRYGTGAVVFPMPDPNLTQPAVIIHPHPSAEKAKTTPARIANREEVKP
jgi:anaerobic dimethyl sulfoxide reductase subunit B